MTKKIKTSKIKMWFKNILVGLIGVAEFIIKCIKEVISFILDVLFPLLPKFESIISKFRIFCNNAYNYLSETKDKLRN